VNPWLFEFTGDEIPGLFYYWFMLSFLLLFIRFLAGKRCSIKEFKVNSVGLT
jgi:hypothetical protein